MKYLKQFGIILFISFLGEILNFLIPLPIPASIYGIVILLLALKFKIVKISDVDGVSKFLIEIMPIMFVPAAVGLINSFDIIKESYLEYIILIVVSTVCVMAVSGLITKAIIKLHKKNNREDKNNEGILE